MNGQAQWKNWLRRMFQLKYKIIEDELYPTDRSFRDAWEVDEAELTDGVGA